MLIKTQSNRIYSYDPLSNRLSTNVDKDDMSVSTIFELSDAYDFSQIWMYTIEVTQQCNLRCKYCCYSGEYSNRREHNSLEMSSEDLRKCVDLIIKHSGADIPTIPVCFYGGEALLCIDKIKWVIAELTTRCPDKSFEFSISTNGLLLSNSVIDWVCETPNLYLTITIDGNKAMHDKNRVTKSGDGSYDIILKNLASFRNKYPELYKQRIRFISTVKSIEDLIPLNDFWMSEDLLCNNRPQHISSIIPNFDKGESVSDNREKFARIYDLGLNHLRNGIEDVLTDELHKLIKVVKNRYYQPLSNVQTLSTCLHKPNSCFISSKGDLYACERFCGQFKIGSLKSGFNQDLCDIINRQYISRKNLYCGSCWAQRLCRRCAIGLNYSDEHFNQYCRNEKMQLELALKYFCELLEIKHGIN